MVAENEQPTGSLGNPGLTVIVPVFNQRELTQALLNNIQRNVVQPDQIVLIDDGSSEDIMSLVREFPGLPIDFVRRRQNAGPNSAWRIGIEMARHDLVGFLNNDIVFSPYLFKKALASVAEDQKNQYGLFFTRIVKNSKEVNDIDEPPRWGRTKNRKAFGGCCFFIRRETLEVLAPIPKELTTFCGDRYLRFRIGLMGYHYAILQNAPVYHIVGQTIKEVYGKRGSVRLRRQEYHKKWQVIKKELLAEIRPMVELIHPPHPQAIEDRLDAPLGLLYVAGMLSEHNIPVRINDLSGIKEGNWEIGKADIYGMTVYIPSIGVAKKIASVCRSVNPKAKIVAGGACPTAMPSEILSFVDSVVIGEGEFAFLRLAREYPNIKRQYQIPLGTDLDLYPGPAYHLADLKSYKRTIAGKKAVAILTSRGCPYRCAFCGLARNHRTVKLRSPEAVVEEVKFLKQQYGIEAFNFQDDSFTINRDRLYHILELLEPLNIVFRCHGRVGNDRREDYVRLKRAGCEIIAWGIESGSQKILDKMNKKVTVAQNEEAVRWAKEVGITSRAFFIFGFPGESEETVEETKRFIERADPDQYFVSNFVPYPGTDVWNKPKDYGIVSMSKDFREYYQVAGDGAGGRIIETVQLSTKDFVQLEKEFREWLLKRGRRGALLDYERELDGNYAKHAIKDQGHERPFTNAVQS